MDSFATNHNLEILIMVIKTLGNEANLIIRMEYPLTVLSDLKPYY